MFMAYLCQQYNHSQSTKQLFATSFHRAITHQLNIIVTETGMSSHVRKTGYLSVTCLDFKSQKRNSFNYSQKRSHSTSKKKSHPDKPLKLKSKKRWIELDRQRLTYFKTRSTKKMKGTFLLDASTTRMSIAPPLPEMDGGGSSRVVEYTKPWTMKIENDAQKIILYLKCDNEVSFREWYQSISIRLMSNELKQKISTYSPLKK
jgi:hypothetical protein